MRETEPIPLSEWTNFLRLRRNSDRHQSSSERRELGAWHVPGTCDQECVIGGSCWIEPANVVPLLSVEIVAMCGQCASTGTVNDGNVFDSRLSFASKIGEPFDELIKVLSNQFSAWEMAASPRHPARAVCVRKRDQDIVISDLSCRVNGLASPQPNKPGWSVRTLTKIQLRIRA